MKARSDETRISCDPFHSEEPETPVLVEKKKNQFELTANRFQDLIQSLAKAHLSATRDPAWVAFTLHELQAGLDKLIFL